MNKKHKAKAARFWVSHRGSPVMIALKDGQSVRFEDGGPTDEGWRYTCDELRREGGRVFLDHYTDGQDCDGRMSTESHLSCALSNLGGIEHEGTKYPVWSVSGRSQRDYSAEAMGY